MVSRFTALPLANGESFVLETEHDSTPYIVLFDGGQSKVIGPKNGLYQAIREHCPGVRNKIDIAICSHSDVDHSGGFPSFVETWVSEGNEIGEFWLPALWSPALPEVLINPDRLLDRLRDGAMAVALQLTQPEHAPASRVLRTEAASTESSFRSVDQMIRDMGMKELAEGSDTSETVILDRKAPVENQEARVARSLGLTQDVLGIVRRNLEESDTLTIPLKQRLVLGPPSITVDGVGMREFGYFASQLQYTLLNSVVETAEAIQTIARIAATNEIPIRWFDFTPFERKVSPPKGGIPGFLQPLNTVELASVRQEVDSRALFFSLKLTEQNVSSLVFQRAQTTTEPAVVFVADSRLAFGIDEPTEDFPKHLTVINRPCIFTAAHHGSRNNDRAYQVLSEWLGTRLYNRSFAMRNGGVHNQTLDGYLRVKNRRCAQCYQCHGGEWAQPVSIRSVGANWLWPPDCGSECGIVKSKRQKARSTTPTTRDKLSAISDPETKIKLNKK